jgi:hypothetical protein
MGESLDSLPTLVEHLLKKGIIFADFHMFVLQLNKLSCQLFFLVAILI